MKTHEYEFIVRTLNHIALVQNCALMLYKEAYLPVSAIKWTQIKCNVLRHDHSKFDADILPAYATYFFFKNRKSHITPKNVAAFEDAWKLHYTREIHHPEHFLKADVSDDQRLFAAIECVCDLQAMAIEFKEGSCRKYYEKVWKPKYKEQLPLVIMDVMERAVDYFDRIYTPIEAELTRSKQF